ncbi:hypothetical protein PIB30_016299 [Stylosanthes scabra]|uniref:GRF-type domain-containing protein n=1 Tax=Stylosanthes scabra TaxID=79078 RepID=A0ABU6Q753_9FABA|nr:hypothetical protein [Stylosanthes scabra]
MQVLKSAANMGREYYACPTRRCTWFRWAGSAVKYSARHDAQNLERDGEESKVDLGSNLLQHERVGNIENECLMLKMLVCMNLLGFMFCMSFYNSFIV